MNLRPIDAIVAGDVCLDIIPRFLSPVTGPDDLFAPGRLLGVGEAVVTPGGPVSNTGVALAKAGLETVLVARLGADAFGGLVRERLGEWARIEHLREVRDNHTSYTIAIAPAGIDRIYFHSNGANDDFQARDVSLELSSRASMFHFGYPPNMRRIYENDAEELIEMFRAVKAAGAVTSLDMQFPNPGSESARMDWRSALKRLMPYVDFFQPSIGEALYLLDRKKLEGAEAKARGGDPIPTIGAQEYAALADLFLGWGAAVVTLKAGPSGIYVRTGAMGRFDEMEAAPPSNAADWSHREIWSPAIDAPAFVSAVGSGDAAVGGFLAAWFKGESIETCAACANANGCISLRGPDGASALGDWDSTMALAKDSTARRLKAPAIGDKWRYDTSTFTYYSPRDGS